MISLLSNKNLKCGDGGAVFHHFFKVHYQDSNMRLHIGRRTMCRHFARCINASAHEGGGTVSYLANLPL